ncbi:MAG: Thiamine biosynthesis lipoprotein ApbE precursor [Bacteroidota bacterium]|jgi:thiamine biosynthesis lipoprotein
MSRYTILLFIFLLLNVSFRQGFNSPIKIYSLSGLAQGTSYRIKYKHHKELIKQHEIDSIFTVFESSLSRYNKASLLYKLNKAKSKARIDSHLLRVLHYAQDMGQKTNSCFEYRLLPLLELWGFGNNKQKSIPDTNQINKTLHLIRSSQLKFNKSIAIKSTKILAFDLDGIAQGYCVDQLSYFLRSKGIEDFIVELGGEVFVSGSDLENESWKVGIEDALNEEEKNKQFILSGMNQVGVTTSGSLQKYKKIGDQYFSHIIDPRTGYPVQNGIVSVTVIAPSAMEADALDNAFMVMGINSSFEWCKNNSNIGLYISYVNPKGSLVDTTNSYFKQFLKKIKN